MPSIVFRIATPAMLAKLLLTAAVLIAAYAVLRLRLQPSTEEATGSPLLSWRMVRSGAYAMIAVILLGSAGAGVYQWQRARDILEVHVVNPATNVVDVYQARRADIKGRGFRTLDGKLIRIAESERMIQTKPR